VKSREQLPDWCRDNANFGNGATVRRIRLTQEPGRVHGELQDTFHEMSCVIEHDAVAVTAVSGAMTRYPATSCPGAASVLQELVGLSLRTPLAELYGGGRGRRHCTHLLDLAVLAIVHASRAEPVRYYEVVVPDETDSPVVATAALNGRLVHEWRAFDGVVTAPEALRGLPLRSGFAAWASRRFAGDELEAATALARTYFISRGRRYDLRSWAGHAVNGINARSDICYTYLLPQRLHGRFLGTNGRDLGATAPPQSGA
jgi:hypothetical protein